MYSFVICRSWEPAGENINMIMIWLNIMVRSRLYHIRFPRQGLGLKLKYICSLTISYTRNKYLSLLRIAHLQQFVPGSNPGKLYTLNFPVLTS